MAEDGPRIDQIDAIAGCRDPPIAADQLITDVRGVRLNPRLPQHLWRHIDADHPAEVRRRELGKASQPAADFDDRTACLETRFVRDGEHQPPIPLS